MPRMGGHGARGGMPGDKAKDFKGTLKKLVRYMSAFKVHMIFVVLYLISQDRRSWERRRPRSSTVW